ncbi:hypothetical protein Tco_1581844, partial [Tanacetum coccineum]
PNNSFVQHPFKNHGSVPAHTVEEIKEYVQKQCDIDDAARQEAIITVSKLFNKEYHAKQALNEQYAECKDIPPERRDVIQKILEDESMKDLAVRILQKSQENGQNRTNTDAGKEREYKSRENAIKGQQKSTLGQY